MTAFDSWKYLHILMFVFWIGTDLGVYLSARKSTDPKLSFGELYGGHLDLPEVVRDHSDLLLGHGPPLPPGS